MPFAPLSWRRRLLGLLAGALWVFVLNQARVFGLVVAAGHDRGLFDRLHGTVLRLVLVSAVGAFFLAWSERAQRRTPRDDGRRLRAATGVARRATGGAGCCRPRASLSRPCHRT